MLCPKLFTTLKDYSKEKFASDLLAGVIVGIVSLPLAIAFAIASGVTPEKGLITAVIAGFLISALGGSRVQIGGPTGAFVIIVYGIVRQYGVEGLLVATFLAGILLVVMGLARLGSVIKFIPHPVTVGFTSGIAVVIFSSQVKDFLGLPMDAVPAEFLAKWVEIFRHLSLLDPYALTLSLGTVLVIAFWPRVSRKVPGSLVAVVLASVIVKLFHWPVETIGSRFGEFQTPLSMPVLPAITFTMVQDLMKPAMTIALLGGIESLLSAVVSDGMIGGRHRSNMELVAQGIANIFSALFGGIPATGAIARTVTNIKNGGRTPVAGIVHSLTVLVLVLFLGRWVKLIPLASLAGILAVVSYHMSEWRSFRAVLKGPRSGGAVLVATFLLTVFVDLTVAIEFGIVLSAFLFMHRMARVSHVKVMEDEVEEEKIDRQTSREKIKIPEGVEIYEINGPFFFGISHKFEEATRIVSKMPKVRILKLQHVPFMDSTGLHALKAFHQNCKQSHIRLLIAGIQVQPLGVLKKSGLLRSIGEKNIFLSIREALQHLRSGDPKPPARHPQPALLAAVGT